MGNLKVSKINISNLLGIEDLEITPTGNVVEISGTNGQGKTSVLESVKAALGISDYTKLLRNGEESGQVTLDLGDMKLERKYTEKGDKLKLQGKVAGTDSYSALSSPAKLLKGLFNPNSVNPLSLLSAKPKELVDVVLAATPMSVDNKLMEEYTGKAWDADEHALTVLDQATKEIFTERTGVNRDLKTAKTTYEQLQATLPEVIPSTSEIEEEITQNNESMENIKSASRKVGRKVRQEYSEQLLAKEDEVLAVDADIQKLLEQIDDLKETKASLQGDLRSLSTERDTKAEAAVEAELAKADDLQERNQQLSKELSELGIYANTQRQVNDWKAKVKEYQKQSDGFTDALEILQNYKQDLCSNLPIEGLEIKDGILTLDGVPFETLNTASRVKLAIELAKLSAGDLGLILIDNSESLDKTTYAEFIKQANKSDLQFIVSRVAETDLTIK